jgi:hypothetical protein
MTQTKSGLLQIAQFLGESVSLSTTHMLYSSVFQMPPTINNTKMDNSFGQVMNKTWNYTE